MNFKNRQIIDELQEWNRLFVYITT